MAFNNVDKAGSGREWRCRLAVNIGLGPELQGAANLTTLRVVLWAEVIKGAAGALVTRFTEKRHLEHVDASTSISRLHKLHTNIKDA